MSARKPIRRVRRSEAEWRWLLSRFATSAMSAEAFCRAESISVSSLHRWRALLGDVPTQRRGAEPAPAFVDLGAVGAIAGGKTGARLELKLDLGDGVVLHLVRG